MAEPTPNEAPEDTFVVPDYGGPCVSNIVPALLEYPPMGDGWMPDAVGSADQVVLLVLDGLGWHQLQARRGLAPTLAAATGAPITTVAPSTTAAALTSIATGVPPAEHGIVGYKIWFGDQTLNVLQWRTENGDATATFDPARIQPIPGFGGRNPTVVHRAEYARSGFTQAHLLPSRYRGYHLVSTMVLEIAEAIEAGERFVYAYYDGLDRIGHARGHDDAFDAEFAFVDRLVSDIRDRLGPRVALLVTADHGQVDCGGGVVDIDRSVLALCRGISGEDRFLWLHSQAGVQADLLALASEHHSAHGWVLSRDEAIEMGLFGANMSSEIRSRLGDVAVLARRNWALVHPDAPPKSLIGRHGSVTAAEMMVPLLAL